MARVKAEYFNAKDKATGEIKEIQFIPPAPSDGDLGGISQEKLEQIDELKGDLVELDSRLSESIVEIRDNVFESVDKTISKNELSDYVDSVFENGYYDGVGGFSETTDYKNWQIEGKGTYTIGFANTNGYTQMSVFSGAPSKDTHVGRYRTSDNNLPTFENPMTIPSGYVVVIMTVTYTTTNFDVQLSYANGVKFNADRTEEIKQIAKNAISEPKKKYIKYINGSGENSSTERLEIYIPMVVGYLMYTFARCVVSSDKCDIWRITTIKACDDNLNVRYALSSNGEWECAVRLNGRNDFAGGYMHGDEVYANLTVFVDGIETSRYDLATMRSFDELVITEKSSLFDPNDHTTIIADHGSKHVWTDSLLIEQMLTWRGVYQLDPSYLAMYPPLKTVTSKWYNNSEYNAKEISLPQTLHGCDSVTLYDTDKGFSSTFAVTRYPSIFDTDGYFFMSDNGGNPYNKCYYAVVGYGKSVSNNEIWRSKTEYSFEIVK